MQQGRLFVIARNSTMVYKGKAVDVKQVGREQGVHYVLEGSVRRRHERIRVTAQLVDALSGHQMWADRYDRELDDLFEVQDEITRSVVVELQIRLTEGEQARVWASGTKSIEAWELAVRAEELSNSIIRTNIVEARRLAAAALSIDPNYVFAWCLIGWSHFQDAYWAAGESVESSVLQAVEAGRRAVEIDAVDPEALAVVSCGHILRGEYDDAVSIAEKAVKLAPNHAQVVAVLALVLMVSGEVDRALPIARRALRLCPVCPSWYIFQIGICYYRLKRYDKAIETFEETLRHDPDSVPTRIWLTSTLVDAGFLDKAKGIAQKILELDPNISLSNGAFLWRMYRNDALNEEFTGNLRRAGLPG